MVSIAYQRKKKVEIKKFNQYRSIRWLFTKNGWCQWKFGGLLSKKRRVLIVFDMIVDIEANKKLHTIVTGLSLDFITQSYSKVPKTTRLNATHYFFHENT